MVFICLLLLIKSWNIINPFNFDTATEIRIIKVNFTIGDITFPRYSFIGHGPLWRKKDGIGMIWIDRNLHNRFHIRYINEIDQDTAIHAHGLIPFKNMDGVPCLENGIIPVGQSVEYNYPIHSYDEGVHWIHSHYGFQHELGSAAPGLYIYILYIYIHMYIYICICISCALYV